MGKYYDFNTPKVSLSKPSLKEKDYEETTCSKSNQKINL